MKVITFYTGQHSVQRKRRKRRDFRPLLVLLLFVLLLTGIGFGVRAWIIKTYYRDEDGNVISYVADLPIHTDYVPAGVPGRPGIKRTIEYVVIHETDNFSSGANAKRHNAYLHKNAEIEELSWHYTVDEAEVYHHIPDDEMAYHAGDGTTPDGGNTSGIGIELCVAEDNDYEKTLENGAILAGYLLSKYDLGMDALKRHQDFSGKVCPSKLITQNRWEAFYQMVQEQYEKFEHETKK